jgi:hypothetical protein
MSEDPATNDFELTVMLGEVFKSVVSDVSDFILQQIQMSILSSVYSYPEGQYERLGMDGGFLGAWTKDISDFAYSYIVSTIAMDATKMIYDSEKHQHGNSVEDRRVEMDVDIAEGTNYDYGGNASIPRDYWTVIDQIVTDGSLDKIVEDSMMAHGLNFVKV